MFRLKLYGTSFPSNELSKLPQNYMGSYGSIFACGHLKLFSPDNKNVEKYLESWWFILGTVFML